MSFFDIIIGLVPIVIFWMVIDWELAYYKRYQPWMRYRTAKARMAVYLAMLGMGIGAILVALPFIVLFMFRPI